MPRVDALRETIERDCRQHRRWMYFWLAFYVVLTAVLVLVFVTTRKAEVRHAVFIGYIGSTLGILGLLISALTGSPGKGLSLVEVLGFLNIFKMPLQRFHYEMSSCDVPSDELLAAAENAVLERAKVERLAWLWINRVPGLVVITTLSIILWLVYHEPAFAAVNMFAGLVITQAQYYTQPSAAMKAIVEIEAAAGPADASRE
jgi:uncharacterized integral membrane protein